MFILEIEIIVRERNIKYSMIKTQESLFNKTNIFVTSLFIFEINITH